MADIFNINDLIFSVSAGELNSAAVNPQQSMEYKDALDKIRHIISKYHSAELINVIYSPSASDRLKNLIIRHLNQNRMSVKGFSNLSKLADKIYEDMAGFGILTKYLQDREVEEININAWNCVEVIYPDRIEFLKETFVSPDDCMDKIKKMVWLGGSIIDGSNPKVDSFIGEGVRISVLIPPCVDSKTGGVASIRIQKEKVITRRLMIEYGSATPEELEFLPLCINNGVSLAIAGSTGSGKTADLTYLISRFQKDKRIYTIEDTRELNIAKYEEGRMINRVVQTITKEAPNPITMDDLLKEALRFHPYAIIPAEMRGAEAMTAVEAGRTGHVIITTLHANSAVDAYNRILSMCVAAGMQLSETKILEFILEAIPLVLFKRQLPDGRRVYDEIFEGTGIKDGKVIGNKDNMIIPNCMVSVGNNRDISVTLPKDTVMDYNNRITVTVSSPDKKGINGVAVSVVGKDKTESGITNVYGKLTVPNGNQDYTDNNGHANVNAYIVVANDETKPIEDAIVTYTEGANILVTLPESNSISYDNRVTVTVLTKNGQPVQNMNVAVSDFMGNNRSGITDEKGQIFVPPLNEDISDSEGEAVVDDLTVIVENENAKIANALVTHTDGKVLVSLPEANKISYDNRITVTVLKDSEPVVDKIVIVSDTDSNSDKGITNTKGQVVIPPRDDDYTDESGAAKVNNYIVMVNDESQFIENAFVKFADNKINKP